MENKVPERLRRFMIVINNPKEHGFTHDKIKTIIKGMPYVIYWCMSDEIGNIFIETKNKETLIL